MATVTKTKGRLKYIEPNDLAALFGVRMANGVNVDSDNSYVDNVTWNPEDMNMSVDLQVVMPNREDCGQISFNNIFAVEINNDKSSAIGRYVSFLQGSNIESKGENGSLKDIGNELTTSYTDATYMELRNNNESNKECIGIESIDITFDSHFYPQVNIKFIDVRGYSLMMPTEDQYRETLLNKQSGNSYETSYNNFFRALFRFPYPRFLLTIKGYYGNQVTFMLAVNEFKNSFNSSTGNFEINVSFIGHVYGLYTDLPFNFLICAPYYGNSANEEDVNSVGSYWKDFHFDNGNGSGNEICTFVEFIKRFDELNKAKKDIEEGKSNNSDLNNIIKLSGSVDVASNLVNDIYSFLNDIVTRNKSLKHIKHLNNSKHVTQLLLIGNSTNDKVYFNKDKYNEIVDKFNSFISNDTIMGISVGNDYTIERVFRDENNEKLFKKVDVDNFNLLENVYFVNDGNTIVKKKDSFELDNAEDDKDIFSKFESDSERWKKGVQLFYFDSVINVLNDFINKGNDKINENRSKTEEIVTETYINALGFDPSIQNVFRMVFAHIDCFMDEFYDLLGEIKKSNRKLSDIGITDKNLTDLNKNSTKNCFVPPFTAFYKIDDNRRVEIYPGETEEGKKLAEVKFIETFLAGALSAKIRSNKYIENAYNDKKYEDENKQAQISGSQNFIITSLTDTVFNGVNPYSYYDEKPTDKYFLGGLLYYFALRYAQSKFQFNFGNFSLNNAVIEANNFLKIHQTVPSDIFKKSVAKYSSNDKDDILKELNNFVTNRNNLVCNITVDESLKTVKISEQKLPLFTKGIINGSSEKILFSEKNSNKKLFNVAGYEWKEDVERIYSSVSTNDEGQKNIKERFVLSPNELDPYITIAIKDGKTEGITNRILDADYGDGGKITIHDLVTDSFKNKSNEEKAAHFLYCLMFNECVHSLDTYGTAIFETRTIKLNSELNRTGVCSMFEATAALIGATLKGFYGEKAKNEGVLYRYEFGGNVSHTNEFYIDKTQYDSIKKDYSRYFIDIFNNFVEKKWNDLNKKIIQDRYTEEKLAVTYYSMSDELRNYIVNNILKDRYCYIYNVCDEHSGNDVEIPLDEFQTFVATINNAYNNIKSIEESAENDVTEGDISVSHKLAAYNAMKNIYDKWANSYSRDDFQLREPSEDRRVKKERYSNGNPNRTDGVKEYDNFVFIDSFYNDISYRFRINPNTIYDLILKQMNNECNYSVYEFMSDICQKNKLLFLALPVINNFYDENGLENMFKPQPEYMMDKGFGSTYVCMYTYEVSHIVEDESQTGLCDDGLDIAGITEDAGQTDVGLLFSESKSGIPLSVPAFGVTYARQNQQYFRNINVNMDNPRVTDYSIANLFELANFKNDGTLEKPYTIANDIYSIYANRSYNCSVEMLGCANITPMMYFQLNNIPMFRGAYMITNVEHHIVAGNFTTTFTGVRISKNQLPYNDDIFSISSILEFNGGLYGEDGLRYSTLNVECTDFDVQKAISEMHVPRVYGKLRVKPDENSKSFRDCVKTVQSFVAKGLGVDISKIGGWGDGYRGGEGDNPPITAKCGFVYSYSFPAGSTREELNTLTSRMSKAGDVAFMRKVNSDKESGHVCMYNGEKWVSDFAQGSVYVYFKYEKNGKTSRDIKVFRHKSCKYVNNSETSSKPQTENGNSVYSNECNPLSYPKNNGKVINRNEITTPYKLFGYKNYNKMTAFEAAKMVIKSLKGPNYFGNSDKSIIRIISMYNGGVSHPSKRNDSGNKMWCYINEAVKYLNQNIKGANLTYKSSLPFEKEYICTLLEFISRKEQGKNTSGFVREAYDAL